MKRYTRALEGLQVSAQHGEGFRDARCDDGTAEVEDCTLVQRGKVRRVQDTLKIPPRWS